MEAAITKLIARRGGAKTGFAGMPGQTRWNPGSTNDDFNLALVARVRQLLSYSRMARQ
jgi:hypothetical protein